MQRKIKTTLHHALSNMTKGSLFIYILYILPMSPKQIYTERRNL